MRLATRRAGDGAEEAHVPGDQPAVEPEDRGKERQPVHVPAMAGGEQERQHGARREAADDDRVAVLAQAEEGLLGAVVPVLPGGGLDVVVGAAVAGELRAEHGAAGARHAVGDVAHLGRRAGEAVDQQHAHPAAGDEIGVVLQNRHTRLVFPLDSCSDTRAIAHAALSLTKPQPSGRHLRGRAAGRGPPEARALSGTYTLIHASATGPRGRLRSRCCRPSLPMPGSPWPPRLRSNGGCRVCWVEKTALLPAAHRVCRVRPSIEVKGTARGSSQARAPQAGAAGMRAERLRFR